MYASSLGHNKQVLIPTAACMHFADVSAPIHVRHTAFLLQNLAFHIPNIFTLIHLYFPLQVLSNLLCALL